MKQFKFNERQRFSIRKFSIGAASVLLGSVFFAVSSVEDVQAAEQSQNVVNVKENKQTPNPLISSNSSTTGVSTKEANTSVSTSNVENKPKGDVAGSSQNPQELEPVVSTISDSNERKLALSKLIEEIDGKFTNGKYASKTEESVNQLKSILEEARSVLSNATTESEFTQAHSKLVTATTQLKTKPTEKKEAPAVDTTNGKATVGKKATNTEKASNSNSIANSGSRDERHGKALDRSNPFRTDASTTDTDPSANQTYTLPGDSANLKEVADSLINLPTKITNETKIASINEVGALQNMAPGELKDINEFGGWKASNGGVFAIARRTDKGVFPIETVNTVLVNYGPYQTWLNESTFDRSQDYALFLAEVRTKATKDEAVDDGSVYRPENHYANKGIGLAKFKGIEKTFKAYSKSTGSDVIVSFKTGFTGDIDGRKAKYRVEVFAKDESGTTSKIYDQTFGSDENKEDATKKVVAPRIGGNQYFNTNREPLPTREALNEKLEQDSNKRRLSTSTGTFTSKGIVLAPNVTEYTVRISPGDNANLGMGYQVPWKQYALPISGLGFTIDQDTSRVAKALLQRVYDKLKETEERDTKGKTEATINAYKTQLENVKNLLAGDLKKTQDYKDIVTAVLADQQALRTDKSKLNTSNNNLLGLINEDPDPRIGKTPNSITPYDSAKTEAISAQAEAQTILNQENPDPDVVAAAVSKLNEKLAELKAARAELVVAATEAQKTKLQNDSNALTEADKTNKTPNSITAYNAKYKELEAALTAAKNQAKAVLDKAENAGKVEATDAQIEVDKIKAELDKAAALLKEKGNTAELEKAKNDLSSYITQQTNANVTDGKTKDSQDAYAVAKNQADQAITDAAAVINSENSTVEDVANALADIKAKKAALEAAKQNLVPAATDAQKTKLDEAAAKLVKASTDGKTQDSVNAYETAYTNLTAELEAAKAKATAVKTAGDNASRLEALAAQEAVDAVLAKLEAAKATLVDKATDDQVAELRKADTALTPAEGSTFEATKTPTSIAAYKNAVDAIQSQLTEAKATAAALVTKAGQNNATKAEAAAAIAKVEALKAKLVDATALLKDKANTGDLATAKDELKALAGVANVTDGKTTSTTEAYDAAKQAADAAVTAAEGIINNADSTPEEVATALTNVKAKKAELEKAKAALVDKITQDQKDDLANAEENLKLADTTGKTKDSIKAYNDEVAKLSDELKAAKQAAKDLLAKGDNAGELEAYRVQAQINKLKSKLSEAAKLLKDIDKSAAKKEVEDAAKKATDAIVANNDLTPEQKAAAKAKVAEEATKAITAIDKATTEDGVTSAKNVGKFAIEKAAAKAEIEAAKSAKEKAINANDKLSDDEKRAANEATAKAAIDAVNAIIAAADQTAVEGAKTTGITAVTAVNPVGKDKALDVIQKATEAKLAEIDKNEKLSDKEKDKAKAEVAKAAIDAVNAIIAAADQTAVDNAKNAGTTAVEAVNPVGKDKALDVIQKATEAKLAEIDKNEKLSDNEKAKAKAKVAKAAIDAVNAIIAAAGQTAVDSAQTTGTTAVATVNPVGKDKALAEIDKALAAKEKEIDANDKLSDAEKSKAKEEAKKVAEAAKKAINAATDQAAVDAKQTEGTKAVSEVNPVGKDKAKAEIEATQVAKEKAIDANPDLTDAEKTAAKAKIAEEAKKAIDAIDKAKTTEEVASAKESGKLAIEKEAEKAEIEAAKAAKEKAIDARTDLTDDEKAKAKAKVAEEAKKAIEAIGNAKTHNDASAKTETGKDDIKKINPIGGKETAKKAIDEALAAKEKAIDARTDLLPEEKEAAKKAAREEAEAAKNAIDKATTSDDIKKVLDNGLDKIAKVNPSGAKEEAKKSIEERLADKEKEIDARTDLTPEEKAKAKALAREEAKAAKDAIDKATSIEAIEKALRPFLYQIDQDALVFDRPALDIKAALQASVIGVVTVERGKAISQADIISKLNLPETVTVMNIDLPDTTTLGRKFAKVTLRLPGGKETTVNVPVEVTPQKNKDVIPSYNGGNDGTSGNNGTTNINVKVDKAKLEVTIRQLDELIIQESAKFDAETAKEANQLLADAKKVFANADASQAEVDAMVKRIEDFMEKVAPATNYATPANDQAAQTPAVAPATTQAAANASQEVATNARKAAKELPNTGTADSTVAMVAAAASALLGLGLAGRRRKEDEEA